MRLKLRPDSGAVSSLASVIASTGAGSATRASRSRSTPSRCAGRRAGAPSANGTTVAGVPRCRTWRSCASVSVSRVTPRPRAVSHVAQFLHEALHAEAERLRVVDGRGEFEAAREAGRGHERRARIGHEAERAVERRDQRRAEAAREPVARQRRGFAERRDAGLAQRRARRVVHVDQRERDRREDAGQLARVGDRLRAAGAGAQQRGERRGRDADARRVTQRVRACGQARGQARQAAEQAQAAADFRDQRVGRRDARHRRERQRPRGELRERARFAVAVAVAQQQFRRQRQRARHELSGADAGVARDRVGGDDARVVAAAADDEGTRCVGGRGRAREDVERQRGEDEAGPEHVR